MTKKLGTMTYLELFARMALICQGKPESEYLTVAQGMVFSATQRGDDIRALFVIAPQHEINKALYCARNNPAGTLDMLKKAGEDITGVWGLLPGLKQAATTK